MMEKPQQRVDTAAGEALFLEFTPATAGGPARRRVPEAERLAFAASPQ
jgi:hypothetical protein